MSSTVIEISAFDDRIEVVQIKDSVCYQIDIFADTESAKEFVDLLLSKIKKPKPKFIEVEH
jgi:hypothetical protein